MRKFVSLLVVASLLISAGNWSRSTVCGVSPSQSLVANDRYCTEALGGVSGWFISSYSRFGQWLKRLTKRQKDLPELLAEEDENPQIKALEKALGHTFSPKSRSLLDQYLDPRHPLIHDEEMRRRVWHGVQVYEFAVMDQLFRMNPVSSTKSFNRFRRYVLHRNQRARFLSMWASSLEVPYKIPKKFRFQSFSLFLLSLLAEEKAETVLDALTRPELTDALHYYPQVLVPYLHPRSNDLDYLRRYAVKQIALWASANLKSEADLETFDAAIAVSQEETVLEILSERRYAYWGDKVLARFWADALIAGTDPSMRVRDLALMSDQMNSNATFEILSNQIVRQGALAIVPEHGGAFLETTVLLIYNASHRTQGDGFKALQKPLAAIIRPELRRLRSTLGNPAHAFLTHWVASVDPRRVRIDRETRGLLRSLYMLQRMAIRYGVVGDLTRIILVIKDLVPSLNTTVPSLPEVWRSRIEPGLIQTLAVIAAHWGVIQLILPAASDASEEKPAEWIHAFLSQLLDYYENVDVLAEWLVKRVAEDPKWLSGAFWMTIVARMSDHSIQALASWLILQRNGNNFESIQDAAHYEQLLESLIKYQPRGRRVFEKVLHPYDFPELANPSRELWLTNLMSRAS